MTEWISVEDRLPQLNEPVWIYWRDRSVLIGWKTALDGEPEDCWFSFHGGEKCRFVNYWMPITRKHKPEKPKEQL